MGPEDLDITLKWFVRIDHQHRIDFGYFIAEELMAAGFKVKASLMQIVDRIKLQRPMPIHIEHPEIFKKLFRHLDVRIVEKGSVHALVRLTNSQ